MNSRLQFRHHTPIFETREKAIQYIFDKIKLNEEIDVSQGFSVFAEPTVLRYKNEENESNPHVILVIGADTNESGWHFKNRFCIIDIDKTEKEIADIEDALEEAIKSLTIITKNTDTLNLYAEKTESGTVISGDVKVAENCIFDDVRKPNVILETEDGIFTYVNMSYDGETDKLTFTVNGETKEWDVNNNYLINGYYDKTDESLHLIMKDGTDVEVNLEDLIDEWDVEGDASKTPIVLTKEKVGYGNNEGHNHVEPWQDVLKADVRISEDRDFNILEKTNDGKYLYVDGKASNIAYYSGGSQTTVKDVLDELTKIGLSTDNDNIIIDKVDGFFASTKLEYKSNENKLIFKASGQEDTVIALNTVELFTNIYYDPTRETLVIQYKDDKGEIQTVEIPIGEMLTDWEWEVLNEGHNVKLTKVRVVGGNDKLSADLNISNEQDNILVDNDHNLYVKGTADNIKYGSNSNVATEIDVLHATDELLDTKIDDEVTRATNAENTLNDTIGSGFSTDAHETVTYKFNQEAQRLSDEIARATNKESALETSINNEVSRATSAETSLQTAINNEVSRATSAEDTLDDKIDAETTRATNAENTLDTKIDTETTRATNAENTLNNTIGSGFSTDAHETVTYKFNQEAQRLSDEIVRSTNKDNELTSAIANEVSRATSAETSLQTAINNEVSRATNAEGTLDTKIDAEISRAQGVETSLESKIEELSANTEGRLSDINSDNSININKTNPTKPYINVKLSTEIEDGKSNIIKLNNDGLYVGVDLLYNDVTNTLTFKTTNGSKNIALVSNSVVDEIYYDPTREALIIKYKVNGHQMPDVVVPLGDLINEWNVTSDTSGAIKLEKTRRDSGTTGPDILSASAIISSHSDNILINDSGSLYVSNSGISANASAIASLGNRMSTAENDIDNLESNLAAEISRAQSVENELTRNLASEIENRINDVNAEEARAIQKENAISGVVANLSATLAQEITRATTAEATLDEKIDDEITRATNTEQALRSDLTQEVNTRTAAVLAEQNRAISAETALQTAINNEVTRATNKDNELSTVINNEVTRSTNKDNELSTALTQEVNARTAADLAEKNRAISAETALQTAINNEVTRATNAEDALETLINNEVTRSTNKDNELSAALNNEVTRSTNKDNELSTALTQEVNARTAADLAEKNRATSAETVLQTAINNEATRATNAESTIASNLANEITRASGVEADLSSTINTEISNRESAVDALDDKIDNEIARAKSAESALSGQISTIGDDYYIDVDDTNTVSLDKVSQSRGSIIKASVNISSNANNIIKENANGIFSTVDLTYDSTSNKLTFTTTNGNKQIALVSNSIIDKIYYDAANEAIVIEYTVNGTRMEDVVVPVRELINQITVQSTSSVELTKTEDTTSGADVIKANVRLNTTHSDNILVNDGGLYVSGAQIATNTANITSLTNRVTSAESNISTLDGDLEDAISDFAAASGQLNTAIVNEVTRSTNKDASLETAINNEVIRSTNKDNELSTALTQEVNARTAADLTEQNRATSAETALRTAINNEATRATSAETMLNHLIDDVDGRVTGLDGDVSTLETSLNNEITRATGAESSLQSAINSEVTRATTSESNLQTAINSEVTRATNAESSLRTAIDSLTGVTGDVGTLSEKIYNEITRATSAETALDRKIEDETRRASGAESTLDSKIEAETRRASGAEETLRSMISTISGATIEIEGESTNTVDVTTGKTGNTVFISANVKYGNEAGLSFDGEGLQVKVASGGAITRNYYGLSVKRSRDSYNQILFGSDGGLYTSGGTISLYSAPDAFNMIEQRSDGLFVNGIIDCGEY